ncbi:type III secretion system chaperone family protein [Robiginitomaculum antarcticum]|uniref:YbjN domain-containing protein n=1 Tax=Robiginitomaculum antarcticum TaxID=437507 RepID=UPI0014616570|nr:YbjN domain-containing protein [Robiginitomaculum antarcticum]
MPLPKSRYRAALNPASGAGSGLLVKSIDFIRQNPLDVFWRIAIAENYDRERLSMDELHISMSGEYADHHVSLSWTPADEILQLFLVFDGKLPGGRTDQICRLLSLINERLPSGHFDFWGKDDALVYRNAMTLAGHQRLGVDQALALLSTARDAAETGYPACQFMLWAGQSPDEAIDSALLAKNQAAQ